MLSLRKRDAEPLPEGRFAKVTVPLYYQGHAYRAGLADPRDDRRAGRRPARLGVRRVQPKKPVDVAVARSASMPSRLVLPVVPGVSVPTALPPCPSLRGQPCRATAPIVNRAG